MKKYTSFSRVLLVIALLFKMISSSNAQLISEPTLIPAADPLTINYTVGGSLYKRANLDLNTSDSYAHFSIVSEGEVILDNINIPSSGNHTLNALVKFNSAGEKELKLVAREGDVTINDFSFEDVTIEFPSYEDITEEAGLVSENSLKYGGPSIADIDNDGDYDIIANNHNDESSKLYWNDGDGTVTQHDVNLARWKRQDLHGSAAGDYDNDGDLDLLLTLGGGNGTSPQPPVFYKNEGGTLVLSTTDVGITKGSRGRSVRWLDLDLDGDLDLALMNAHGINGNNGAQHIFYENKGDGTFDIKAVEGLENASGERLLVTDFNNDHIDDIIMLAPVTAWQGNGDFTFTDVSSTWLPQSVRNVQGGLAATDIDVDNDGDLDIYLTRGQGYFSIADRTSYDFDPIAETFDFRGSGSQGSTLIDFSAAESFRMHGFDFVRRNGYEGGYPIFLGSDKTVLSTENEDETFIEEVMIDAVSADGWSNDRSENGIYIGYLGNGEWRLETVRTTDIYWSIHYSIDDITDVNTAWEPNNRNLQDIFLMNEGSSFVDVSDSWNIPQGGNHWGVTTGDFNNDSYPDLFIHRFGFLNQRISDYMLINTGENKFEITTSHQVNNRGSENHGDMGQAFDFDLDGDIDILNGDDEFGQWHLYGNNKADENNYALVKVGYAPLSNVDPISAEVTVVTEENTYFRRVGSAGEVHSQSLLNIVHFGLGEEAEIESITIRWRDGETVVMNNPNGVNTTFDTDSVDPTSVSVTPNAMDVRVGTLIELEAIIEPINANTDITWSSSDGSIASVDQNGVVSGLITNNQVTITATSDANGIMGTATINVVDFFPIAVESVNISPDGGETIEGETLKLEAAILPKYSDDQSIEWSSSDTDIAEVDQEGLVTAISAGEVSIVVTTNDGDFTDQVTVTVIPRIEASISLDDESIYLDTEYETGTTMEVTTNYHAGTGNKVIASNLGGINYLLREMNPDWSVAKDYSGLDTEAIGEESGTSSTSISLEETTINSELSEGNFYFLFVRMASSNGITYEASATGVTIVGPATEVVSSIENDHGIESNINIYPNPSKGVFSFKGLENKDYSIKIFNSVGSEFMNQNINNNSSVDVTELPSGIYTIVLESKNSSDVFRLLKE